MDWALLKVKKGHSKQYANDRLVDNNWNDDFVRPIL